MTVSLDQLQAALQMVLGEQIQKLVRDRGEITIEVPAAQWHQIAITLRDHADLKLEQLIDLCGMDYADYRNEVREGPRFAVVTHLLSVSKNWRLRVRVFAPDDELPAVPSVTDVWTAGNWFEREAFDLYGIVFEGHLDLRRILTDYGFIGHPMRKDFPVSGHVEMRYDPEQKRVIYQPVTIEPREITPRIVREENYGG